MFARGRYGVVEDLNAFLDLLYSFKVRRGEEDQLLWNPTKSRLVEVKSWGKLH
jgi:hypothetical protein